MTEEISNNRPLVTFALFAYNQEQYIREAVEGAFSQTYEPLEIILSDDCSTDRTFEIMQEMAATYDGPHEVKVRRNATNVGTIDHVIKVANGGRGDILVIAAGDDISQPLRSTIIVESWKAHPFFALVSNHDQINDEGRKIATNVGYAPLERFQKIMNECSISIRYAGKIRNIPGYCAAYDRKFIASTPPARERLFNEDSLFSYLINFEGGHIKHVEKSLLTVRHARTSVTARLPKIKATLSDILEREKKISQASSSKMRYYRFLFKVCDHRGYQCFYRVLPRLRRELSENEFVVRYYSMPPILRPFSIFLAQTNKQRRFVSIRFFGIYGMWILLRIQNQLNQLNKGGA